MASPTTAAPVLQVLSAQKTDQLKERICGTLGYIVNTNSNTTYFRDAPLLARYRAVLGLNASHGVSVHGEPEPEVNCSAFTGNVPLSTYEDYRPYISRFMESPCLQSSVDSLLAPGLPFFIATSSGTSGNSAEYFPKYTHPERATRAIVPPVVACIPEMDGPTRCGVFSLRYTHTLDVLDGARGVVKKIQFNLASTAVFRSRNGWRVEDDAELVKTRRHVTPIAVAFVKPYHTFLLLHALFAMGARSLQTFNTMFITVFFDIVRLIETHWEELVCAIETGQIPDLDGLEDLRPHIQAHLRPRPDRAAELREIGANVGAVGWLKQIWPNLALVIGNTAGRFSTVLPRVRDYVGPTVRVQNSAYATSEAWIGTVYHPESGDSLYKTQTTDDVLEYVDVEQPEGAEYITQAWDLEVGKKYELILTTRDGFWRYRLGDVVEIAGFEPGDGSPLIRFMERRSAVMRVSGELVSEGELQKAVKSIEDVTGRVAEFSVVVDDRGFPRRYGFLLELDGEPGPRAHAACRRLQDYLSTNDTYARVRSDSRVGEPSVRIVAAGTFSAYRSWRIEASGCGSGQTKVPTVVYDPEVRDWLVRRVVGELGDGVEKMA